MPRDRASLRDDERRCLLFKTEHARVDDRTGYDDGVVATWVSSLIIVAPALITDVWHDDAAMPILH